MKKEFGFYILVSLFTFILLVGASFLYYEGVSVSGNAFVWGNKISKVSTITKPAILNTMPAVCESENIFILFKYPYNFKIGDILHSLRVLKSTIKDSVRLNIDGKTYTVKVGETLNISDTIKISLLKIYPDNSIQVYLYKNCDFQKIKNIFVCVMRWNNSYPEQDINNLRKEMNEFNKYYNNVSYGKLNFNVNFGGNKILTNPVYFNIDYDTALQKAIESCKNEIDFDNVNTIIIYPAIVPGNFADEFYDKNNKILSIYPKLMGCSSINLAGPFDNGLIEHEVGHTLNFLHAGTYDCGNDVFSSNCEWDVQGNWFDIMGASFYEGHITAYSKNIRGWIIKKNVTNTGIYYLGALEIKSTKPQVLEINITTIDMANYVKLCAEYRKPLGYDDFNSKISDLPNQVESDSIRYYTEMLKHMTLPPEGCLFVYFCSQYTEQLLDSTPNQLPPSHYKPSGLDSVNSCLTANKVLEIKDLGVNISFSPSNLLSDNYAKVDIKLY